MDREVQKQEALKRMHMLKIMPNVIKDFEKRDVVYYSERQSRFLNAILYWLRNRKDYVETVKEFEKETGYLVYHAQLTHTEFGEMLSLLYVSDHEEEWEQDRTDLKNGESIAMVYMNCSCPEMGYIGLRPSLGGVTRTW